VKDLVGGSTYHFNPCGSVHASQCPSGAAVCEITGMGQAISHGLASDAHWADGGTTIRPFFLPHLIPRPRFAQLTRFILSSVFSRVWCFA
jgi:hypothetical protein